MMRNHGSLRLLGADSDERAASTIDLLGGPGQTFDTVSANGIDPLVQMGTLEQLLTGQSYDEIVADPRSGHIVASRDNGERLVQTLTDSLTSVLTAAGPGRLAEVAVPWSRTDEFWGQAEPGELTDFLLDLAGLAERARRRGERLYCWVSV